MIPAFKDGKVDANRSTLNHAEFFILRRFLFKVPQKAFELNGAIAGAFNIGNSN
jgi:hypothetical protein